MADQHSIEGSSTTDVGGESAESMLKLNIKTLDSQIYSFQVDKNKNAMLGGALTGALVSAASNSNRDKIVMDAIAGGAIATAAEFFNHLT